MIRKNWFVILLLAGLIAAVIWGMYQRNKRIDAELKPSKERIERITDTIEIIKVERVKDRSDLGNSGKTAVSKAEQIKKDYENTIVRDTTDDYKFEYITK